MFHALFNLIEQSSSLDFNTASNNIIQFIDRCDDFLSIFNQIGTIPEKIEHDSTQEKLFSKASDAALARAFREIGLKATVLSARGDSADVQAESNYHAYTLVADAKAFRLSRTAKNQKDFKVAALSGWRKDADFAVLCSPYFQYPVRKSQIYAQAVDHNVCLLSWEHLLFLLQHNIKETAQFNLSSLWNISAIHANHCVVAQKQNCYMDKINREVLAISQKSPEEFTSFLQRCQECTTIRAREETVFWENERSRILSYSREQAVAELLKTRKINEKIQQIRKYVAGIKL